MTGRGGSTARQPTRPLALAAPQLEVTAYLSLWLFLLYGFSARQVIGTFGAIGQPALLVALPTFAFWVTGWIVNGSGLSREPHPIRPALLGYLWYCTASFAIAMARPLTELEYTHPIACLR
jgi:hypothetical protein